LNIVPEIIIPARQSLALSEDYTKIAPHRCSTCIGPTATRSNARAAPPSRPSSTSALTCTGSSRLSARSASRTKIWTPSWLKPSGWPAPTWSVWSRSASRSPRPPPGALTPATRASPPTTS